MKKVTEYKVAGILLLATLMLVLAALACGPGKPRSIADASLTPQKGPKTYHFGDAVRVGDLVLTVELVESKPQAGYDSKPILVKYTLENQGIEAKPIADLLDMMHLEDDAGEEYEINPLPFSSVLPPGQSIEDSIGLYVPADAEGVVLVIEADEKIIIKPRNSQPDMLG